MDTQGAGINSDRAGVWPPFLMWLKFLCSVLGSLLSPLPVLTQCLMHIYSQVHHYPSFIHGARHSEAQPSAQSHTARQ